MLNLVNKCLAKTQKLVSSMVLKVLKHVLANNHICKKKVNKLGHFRDLALFLDKVHTICS